MDIYDESKDILEKYKNDIKVLDLGHNQGMQQALNLGVINANNEKIFILNDDNVFCSEWDTVIEEELNEKNVLTINQIEPTGPGFYNFPVKDCWKNTDEFDYDFYIKYEKNRLKKIN